MSCEQYSQQTSHHRQGHTICEGAHQEGSAQAADAEQTAEACGEHNTRSSEEALCNEQHGVPCSAANPEQHDEHIDPAVWPPGYYYQDSDGNTQGPCSLQNLQSLQACFPDAVNMTVWAGDGSEGGFSAQLHEILHWAAPKQHQDPWARRDASPFPSGCCHGASGAVSAQPTQCAYAEAVLAGLPEDDEAVQLARLAKATGNSLESVLQFQYRALSRKEADASAVLDTDPYQDVRSWCPPEEWEAYIADRQKWKDSGRPPCDWKRLKRHRLEIKAKQSATSMEWLRK